MSGFLLIWVFGFHFAWLLLRLTPIKGASLVVIKLPEVIEESWLIWSFSPILRLAAVGVWTPWVCSGVWVGPCIVLEIVVSKWPVSPTALVLSLVSLVLEEIVPEDLIKRIVGRVEGIVHDALDIWGKTRARTLRMANIVEIHLLFSSSFLDCFNKATKLTNKTLFESWTRNKRTQSWETRAK